MRDDDTGAAGTILVTGASGTVGREVVRGLCAVGELPRAFVRDQTTARRRLGGTGPVDIVAGDLDRPETIARALVGVDRVFLLTTQSRRQPQWERAVVEAATRSGARSVVKVSVFRADEGSPLRVARQHREAERALERTSLSWTVLRPVFFMQNLLAMVRGDVIATAAGDGRVAMVDARDVAAAAVAVLTGSGHDRRTYTLTGPEALTFDEVAAVVARRRGGDAPVRHVRVPPEAVRRALREAGREEWFAEDMATLQSMLADGYEDVRTGDVRAVTGRPPRALDTFVADHPALRPGASPPGVMEAAPSRPRSPGGHP